VSCQFINWIHWFDDHKASEYKQNPHTAAWLDHDWVALDEGAWCDERLHMKALRYRQFFKNVYKPALEGCENMRCEKDKQMTITNLNGMLSELCQKILSRRG